MFKAPQHATTDLKCQVKYKHLKTRINKARAPGHKNELL